MKVLVRINLNILKNGMLFCKRGEVDLIETIPLGLKEEVWILIDSQFASAIHLLQQFLSRWLFCWCAIVYRPHLLAFYTLLEAFPSLFSLKIIP